MSGQGASQSPVLVHSQWDGLLLVRDVRCRHHKVIKKRMLYLTLLPSEAPF